MDATVPHCSSPGVEEAFVEESLRICSFRDNCSSNLLTNSLPFSERGEFASEDAAVGWESDLG
jgi:hypothetical protein